MRAILQKHAGALNVKDDTASCYCLDASAGSAAVKAWGGKMKKPRIPVAWVQIGKAYVSFHLMGLYRNTELQGSMSKELKARMQGKTCFNFKTHDTALFQELEELAGQACAAFKKAGYIS